MKGNNFVAGFGDDLEGILISLYFQAGEDAMETLKLLKEVVAKFYIKRTREDEDYLLEKDVNNTVLGISIIFINPGDTLNHCICLITKL